MQKTVDKGSACCLTTTFRSCEHELERSRRKMTNKKFKLAAMSLATAVAVSTVGPSASAVTYYLGDGSVTVDKDDTRGAYSYQGEDGSEKHRTYVNEDEADKGTIYVQDGHKPTETVPPSTDNSNNGTEEPHLRIMPHNPPMLLATTQRTVPRLRPQPQTPSPLWKMSKRRKRLMAPKATM